jgi:nucleoside-diphosphate-sugar epimerase
MEVNLFPIVAMIEACYKNELRPDIIFAGTVTQVGLTDKWPVDEKFKDNPITVYDINKLAAEKYLQYYSNQMGRRAATLRLVNVYGPGPASSNADRNILNAMVRKALKGEVLTIYGEGAFIRDYVYIDDVVRAFLIAGAKMDKLAGNYYVIGTGAGHSIKDMVNIVKGEAGRWTGKKVQVNHVPSPDSLSPIEFRNFIANTNAFKQATGWMAEVSLQEGIKRTVDFFSREAEA